VLEGEDLFLALHLGMFEIHQNNHPLRQVLVKEGYLTAEKVFTPKAAEFNRDFVAKYRHRVRQAVSLAGADLEKALLFAGLESEWVFRRIADILTEEGLLKRDLNGRYRVPITQP